MVRAHAALRIYLEGEGGLSYREVGEQMGVSTQRAHTLVKRALERLAEDTQNLAKVWLARQLELHQLVLRETWNIVTKPCPLCEGTLKVKTENFPGDWVGMESDGVTPIFAEPGTPCPRCEMTGFHYGASTRMQAMDRHERACGHVAKLLGLYAPDRVDLNMRVSWREELAGLSDEDIDIMLLEYARDARAGALRTGYVRAAIDAAPRKDSGADRT
jgi:hypothetical protein